MSWQDNRRRKRTWYKHYRRIAEQMVNLMSGPEPMAAEALVIEFFKVYETYRMHGKRRIANSAWESIALAVKDTGLMDVSLHKMQHQTGSRMTCKGQLNVVPATPAAPTSNSGALTIEDVLEAAVRKLKANGYGNTPNEEVPF
jgi:hypothetical protein